jgi:flagellar basal-body rod modification protein FlgD
MSTIANPLSTSTPAAATPSSSSVTAAAASSSLASQGVFLQLLIAQLKNQDPSQPTDGTQFVTELAQFTTLQEDTESATDLDKIVATLPSTTPLTPAAPSTTNTNQTANS